MKSIIALLLAASLTGCAQTREYPPESPYYAYPGGARLTLDKPIEIPPDAATVRLQYGTLVARNGVHEEDPHCIFELDTVKEHAQRIGPDTLRITGIQRRVQTFAGMPIWPYADTGPYVFGFERRHLHRAGSRRIGFSDDDSPSQIYFLTEFRLHSDSQPQIRALTCMHNQMMPGVSIMRHLTLPEIRQALGGYFTLEPVR
jgi:hypothetical protein